MAFALLAVAEDENSAQRLDDAQQGMAEASWPRKPDQRISPMSGKMKSMNEIQAKPYGQKKDISPKSASGWQKEANSLQKSAWQASNGRPWQEARWNQALGESAGVSQKTAGFQTARSLARDHGITFRGQEPEVAQGWASRKTALQADGKGFPRMYEGRLTRVRETVLREDQSARDLGEGRQEKFAPEEVEKMLSQFQAPNGLREPLKEQPGGASPPATAGN